MYLIFPVKGGRFNAVNKKLRKHEETPTPSSERIFIRPCRTADGKSTFTTTPKPAQIVYSVRSLGLDAQVTRIVSALNKVGLIPAANPGVLPGPDIVSKHAILEKPVPI